MIATLKGKKKFAFGFAFDGASYGAMLEKMSGEGGGTALIAAILKAIALQVEVRSDLR